MKKLNDIKIGRRLNVILSLVMMVILVTIGLYIIDAQRDKIIADTDLRMREQVDDLVRVIEIQTAKSQEEVVFTLNIAERLYGVYKDQIEDNESAEEGNTFDVLVENNDYVDEVSNLTGGTVVSVFKKNPEGYVRVATSLVKDGQRVIGTVIKGNSDVASALNSRQKYTGRAIVVDDWYITSYSPLVENNEIVGAIGVGVREKDLAGLRKIFKAKKYFETGYPFLVDKEGTFIIHPEKEGENVASAEFFQQIITSNLNEGKTYYLWEGRQKYQYFKYAASIDSYVSASIYEDELMDIIKRVRRAISVAVVLGIGIFIFVITITVRAITKALKQGVAFAENISQGNLNNLLDIDQEDEVGQLAKALNNMVIKLKDIVGGILVGSENVSTASQQMSSTSEQLSQGANEQASSVEEVSSTMEEIAANIDQNTDNAQETEKVSMNLQQGIEKVNQKSQGSVDATRVISEKINIINEIAFQTNLLALNAAVEAARAGEHGKGFAVVASEVRKLAERSKVAADEIVDLAGDTLHTVEEAGKLMNEMLPEVLRTVKLVQEISASSFEQRNGANQVNTAIQQLNSVTQQNASASEELASSSEELAAQAEQLQDLIEFFKIDNIKKGSLKKSQKSAERSIQQSAPTAPKASVEKNAEREAFKPIKLDNDFESF